jgi:pantetheine-phosphate adenylyltransferase
MNSSKKYITGVYPGSFDPVTRGHLHLIRRASCIVDKLIVAVAENAGKMPLFTLKERFEMLQNDINSMSNGCEIEVTTFNTLLVHYAEEVKASYIIRGLRAVSDFEYEFQMTGMNAKLDPNIETLFLMASDKWQFVSSSFVKEFSSLNGDISAFVTPQVEERLNKKFKK